MAHLGWSYPEKPFKSFWGEPNAHYNFCEEDFILTPYLAEVINTVTNLTYILYALHGIRKNILRNTSTSETISRSIPYLGLMLVGIGSAIFHATNLYYTQWADDLSMLVASATVLHSVYTYDKSPRTTILWGLAMTVFLTAFAIYHCWADEVILHGLIFAIMILIVGIKTRSIIAIRVTDPFVKREVRKLVWYGTGAFALGYAMWNVDFHGCGDRHSGLTGLKRWIGMPLSFLFELHGWWHVCTGIGAYIFIALAEYLTSEEAGEPLGGRFAWPVEAVCLKTGKAGKRRLSSTERGVSGKSATSNGSAAAASGTSLDVKETANGKGHLAPRMKLT